MIAYLLSIVLFLIGIYCIAVKKNLIKMIIGFVIIEYSLNLFLVLLGFRNGGMDPVIGPRAAGLYVDPLPQAFAMMLIAVGLSTTVIMTAIAMKIYERYGTFDITKIRKLKDD
jgi:multicomponent Na+:H+ antiporter subunit C